MGEHLGHGIRIVPWQPRVREGVEAAESCWVLQSRESRDKLEVGHGRLPCPPPWLRHRSTEPISAGCAGSAKLTFPSSERQRQKHTQRYDATTLGWDLKELSSGFHISEVLH